MRGIFRRVTATHSDYTNRGTSKNADSDFYSLSGLDIPFSVVYYLFHQHRNVFPHISGALNWLSSETLDASQRLRTSKSPS